MYSAKHKFHQMYVHPYSCRRRAAAAAHCSSSLDSTPDSCSESDTEEATHESDAPRPIDIEAGDASRLLALLRSEITGDKERRRTNSLEEDEQSKEGDWFSCSFEFQVHCMRTLQIIGLI